MLRKLVDNKFANVATFYVVSVFLLMISPPLLIFKIMYNIFVSFRPTDMNIRGKVVLITGASSGIGECLAYEYAKREAFLVIVARREERLEKVAEKARGIGSPDVLVICGDVSDFNDCRRFIDEAINHFGRCKISFHS
ncbi:11-beta-hydroxysteroid dehydrogenase-like 4A [Primulina huaijiensis]|uniref:11-beta-hydroxysteroid dehydrogenase-like 4A n=1 Tax=Primulina huaijiensis TaxID=1492673 RepID=UPI003CC7444F